MVKLRSLVNSEVDPKQDPRCIVPLSLLIAPGFNISEKAPPLMQQI